MNEELSPEARALLDLARGVDEPSESDRRRVHAAVLAAATTGAAAVSSTALAASATASAATSTAPAALASAGTIGSGIGSTIGSAIAGAAAAGGGAAVTGSAAGGTAVGVTTLSVTAAKAAAVLTVVSASVGVAVVQPWQGDAANEMAPASAEAAPSNTTPGLQAAPHAPSLSSREAQLPPTAGTPGDAVEPPGMVTDDSTQPEAGSRDLTPTRQRSRGPSQPAPVLRRERAAAEPAVSTLTAELELLRSAQRSLAAQRPAEALNALAEHRRRFPTGQLAAERSGTVALALCRADAARGREAARLFLTAHPRSPLASRVRQACTLDE